MRDELSDLLANLISLTARADALAATHVRDTGRHAWHASVTNYLVECANGLKLLGVMPAAAVIEPTTLAPENE
jgi:hypothetical protein